jgi:toxin FitB
MAYLLDTCTISEPLTRKPAASVLRWMDSVDRSETYLSVISIAEIVQGVAHQADEQTARRFDDWLNEELLPGFDGRILDVDLRVAERWGKLRGASMRIGRPLVLVDSMLAATALVHGLRIVTRNTRDFESLGVDVLNPWKD